MKRVLRAGRCLALSTVLAVLSLGLAQQSFALGTEVTVVVDVVSVRDAPGSSSARVGQMRRGATGVVTDAAPRWEDGTWWWVVTYRDGTRGWSAEGDRSSAFLAASNGDPQLVSSHSIPFNVTVARPVVVVVDNDLSPLISPQYGFQAASQVHELPYNRGVSRLVMVFDRADPQLVGPVAKTSDAMVELARGMDAVMVHAGGSPGALAGIEATNTPTIDALKRIDLFPGSLPVVGPFYGDGNALREAAERLDSAHERVVSGVIFRPELDQDVVRALSVRFGDTYLTGFRFESDINAYRWLRNGDLANDALGDAVLVDAVLLARVTALRFPNDSAGRLYMPLRGGEATLFVDGVAVEGDWALSAGRGMTFTTLEGDVDLSPFKLWVVYAPIDAEVVRGPQPLDERGQEGLAQPGSGEQIAREDAIRAAIASDPSHLRDLIRYGSVSDVRIAVEHGAELELGDEFGQSMLVTAIVTGSVEIVDILVQAGADVNALTVAGWTPLMYAARDPGAIRIVDLLLTSGASPLATSSSGETALGLARSTGSSDVVMALEAEIARVNAAGVEAERRDAAAAIAQEERDRSAATAQPDGSERETRSQSRATDIAWLLNEPVSELIMLTSNGGRFQDARWTSGIEPIGANDAWLAAWFETTSSRRLYLLHVPTGSYCRWAGTPNLRGVDSQWMLVTQGLNPGFSAAVSVRIWSGGSMVAVTPVYAARSNGSCIVEGHNHGLH